MESIMNYHNNSVQLKNQKHLLFLLYIFLILLAACSKSDQGNKESQKKARPQLHNPYNIVFISIDTLRADHLGCYGYQRNTSPNIDRFANHNTLFKNFYTAAPKTGPSMTSFFTGLYIQHHGVVTNGTIRSTSIKSFVELLPASIKKVAFVANPTLNKHRGYARGFDEFSMISPKKGGIKHWGQAELVPNAIQWLKGNKNEPFFLWVHFLDPHGPYTPPDKYNEMFVGDSFYVGKETAPLEYKISNDPRKVNMVLGAIPRYQRLGNHNVVDYYIAQYDAEIRYTDDEVGKLLNYIKESSISGNTIIIITADHGESLGKNNYFFEHGMFVTENLIRIPLIISYPTVKEKRTINTVISSTDVAPTILAEYGIKFENKIDGRSFSAILHGKQGDMSTNDYAYSCTSYLYDDFYESVRKGDYKLVRKNERSFQFFNINNDPEEEHDIYRINKENSKMDVLKDILKKFGKEITHKGRLERRSGLQQETIKGLRDLGYIR